MGAVAFDINATSRQLANTYHLWTKEGVESFLENFMHMESARSTGADYDVVVWLLDFKQALLSAGMSPKEWEVVYHLYVLGYKQKELADKWGVAKNTINTQKTRAIAKIAEYHEMLKWKEDGHLD